MFFDTIHNIIKSRSITIIIIIHIDYIRNFEFVIHCASWIVLSDSDVSFVIHLLLFDCPLIIARFAVVVKGFTVLLPISIPDGYAYRWLCNELMKVRHPQDFYWSFKIFMRKDFSPFIKDCSGIMSMFLSFLIKKFMKPLFNLIKCNIHLVVELFISH